MKPRRMPIGLQLTKTSRIVSREFGAAVAEAGGSVPMFLVLSNLMGGERPTQQELARALEIEGPTLTRHLDGFERAGLVRRVRDDVDRRATRVEITEAGRKKHGELLTAVIAFDKRLRSGFGDAALTELAQALAQLESNVARRRSGPRGGGAPSA